ncbi:MAG: ATP-binding protein [Syntrophomonas sp.]
MTPYNPFVDWRPVSQKQGFYGREDLVQKLYDSINNPFPESINIIGEKGLGKSSLFNYIFFPEVKTELLENDRALLVHIDFAEKTVDPRDFFRKITVQLCRYSLDHPQLSSDLKDRLQNLAHASHGDENLHSIIENLRDALRRLHNSRIKTVLLIDNFQKVLQEVELKVEEFNFLRSLSDHSSEYTVQYIIACSRKLEVISNEALSSGFVGVLDKMALRPLNDNDMLAFIQEPFARAGLTLDGEKINWLVKMSGGHPYILKVACKMVFDERKNGICYENYETLVDQVVNQCSPGLFDSIWNSSAPAEQQLFLSIAGGHEFNDKLVIQQCIDRCLVKDYEKPAFVYDAFGYYVKRKLEQTGEPEMASQETSRTASSLPVQPENKPSVNEGLNVFIEQLGSAIKGGFELLLNELPYKTCQVMEQQLMSLKKPLPYEGVSQAEGYWADYAENVKEIVMRNVGIKTGSNLPSFAKLPINTVWNYIEEATQEFLTVGEILWGMLGNTGIDLAPVSISFSRAIEMEINCKLLATLKSVYPEARINRGREQVRISQLNELMLGELKYIFRTYYKELLPLMRSYSVDMGAFQEKLEKMRKLRNKSAHPDKVSKNEVDEIRALVLGNENESECLMSTIVQIYDYRQQRA